LRWSRRSWGSGPCQRRWVGVSGFIQAFSAKNGAKDQSADPPARVVHEIRRRWTFLASFHSHRCATGSSRPPHLLSLTFSFSTAFRAFIPRPIFLPRFRLVHPPRPIGSAPSRLDRHAPAVPRPFRGTDALDRA
jgi:hypothetical protein